MHFKNHMSFKANLTVFFRLLKTSVKKRIQKFSVPLFQNDLEILLSLCGAGLIKSFSFTSKNNIVIYLRYDANGAPIIKNIVIAKPNGIKYFSVKNLKNMQNLTKVIWGLFRTHVGVKSIDYCCANNLGGQFLVYII